MGGIGKTTLATAVFNRLCHEFEGFCFLDNVREGVQNHLKKKLLSKLLGKEDVDFFITPNGITDFAKRILCRKKVLIVLDDVKDSDQLEDLCGGHKWFGPTSRIMVTTRNWDVFKEVDHLYQVKALNNRESMQLFMLNAFKQNRIEADQVELSMRVVNYAKGMPLALKVLGSFLYGKSKEEWQSQLDKLEKMPHAKIQNVLKLSYNELDHNDQDIFLYLACFFKDTPEWWIKSLLDSCGYSMAIGLRNLHNKALISISSGDVTMHDLIREMGREVVREESPNDPGKRRRLWDYRDIYEVLKYNRGTEAIESITLDMSKMGVLSLDPQTFARMYKLKLLDIHSGSWGNEHALRAPQGIESLSDMLRFLRWDNCPLRSLPLSFCAENLVEFSMSGSRLEKLWEGVQNLVNLRSFSIKWSENLIQLPDFSRAPNLFMVQLWHCSGLRQVPTSLLSSPKLVDVTVLHCEGQSRFEHNIHLQSHRTLFFNGCTGLRDVILTTSESPSSLTQPDTDTSILPALPEELQFDYWSKLHVLSFDNCSNLSMLPDNIGELSSLWSLSLRNINVRSLPESIKHLSQLSTLELTGCKRLRSLPELPSSIERLDADDCTSLETIFASNPRAEYFRPKFEYFRREFECFSFVNCVKLEKPAINTILADAGVRTKRAAHITLEEMEEDEGEEAFGPDDWNVDRVSFPGRRVPDWFICRTTQSSMTIELDPHSSSTSRFLGFIFCVILDSEGKGNGSFSLGCNYHIEANDGQSVKHTNDGRIEIEHWHKEGGARSHVHLLYDGQCYRRIMRGMKECKGNDEGKTHKLKVSFHFKVSFDFSDTEECSFHPPVRMKECGVHPIYESDVLNLGKQWQMESGLGITSKRRAEITEDGVTSIDPRQSKGIKNEDKKGGKVGKKVVPSVKSRPHLASSFALRWASLFSTKKKWKKKSKTKCSST